MAILEEGKERLELIGMLLADSSKRREAVEATNTHRDDIVNLMIHQRNLEKQFDVLMKKRSELRGLSNKTKYNENEVAIKEMIAQLQQSSTNITTQLGDQPSRLSNLHKLQKDRQLLSTAITTTIDDLKENGRYGQLISFIASRMEEDRILDESRKTEEKNIRAISLLELEIANEEEAFKHQLQEKTALIERLTAELKHLRKVSAAQLQYQRDATEAALEAQRRVTVFAGKDLQQQVETLSREITRDDRGFEHATRFNETQRAVLDTVHEDWQQKLKKDVSSRDALIQQMRDMRLHQKERLSALTESWEKAVDEKTQQTNMLRKRTIEEQAKKELLDRMDWAQRCIRYHWFAYKRRKDAREAEAKKRRKRELREARKASAKK